MGKRQVTGCTEAWLVWLGEKPAIRVSTETEARQLMTTQAREYGVANSKGRYDQAAPVIELVWNEPLPGGATYHKMIVSPAILVVYGGKLRKVVEHLPPSKLASIARNWAANESRLQAWWPNQYHSAVDDSETMIIRGTKPWEQQLAARWPSALQLSANS